jgi:hypothetical protein
MSLLEVPALRRLYDLEEVAAAFVYDRDAKVLAAAVPAGYTEAVLEQLARRLQQITDLVGKARIRTRETRFVYDGFTVWLKTFGSDWTLVVFVQARASILPLRQPINLTVVNLEKAILGTTESRDPESSLTLTALAHRAEMELMRETTGVQDQVFVGRLGILAEFCIGPTGGEHIGHCLRQMEATADLSQRAMMLKLAELVGEHIPNVERRQFFLAEAGDLVDRMEWEATQAAAPSPQVKK